MISEIFIQIFIAVIWFLAGFSFCKMLSLRRFRKVSEKTSILLDQVSGMIKQENYDHLEVRGLQQVVEGRLQATGEVLDNVL